MRFFSRRRNVPGTARDFGQAKTDDQPENPRISPMQRPDWPPGGIIDQCRRIDAKLIRSPGRIERPLLQAQKKLLKAASLVSPVKEKIWRSGRDSNPRPPA
jgi:hypothetical protein